MKRKLLCAAAFMAATPMITACAGVPLAGASAAVVSTNIEAQMATWPNKWTGIVAYRESAETVRLQALAGSDSVRFAQLLAAGLRNGTVRPASGTFVLAPVANQQIVGPTLSLTVGPGTDYPLGMAYVDAPAEWFAPGRTICVQVPSSWPLIAGQRRFPAGLGAHWNCLQDFTVQTARLDFAENNQEGAVALVGQPAG